MAASSSFLAAAVKRLLHDLKEVRETLTPNVSCLPLEDDLFTWHGNVRSGSECSLKGAPIHFILSFPHNYPYKQPECRLLQPIPHPNVKPATSSGTIQVLHATSNQQQPLAQSMVVGSAADCRPHPIPRQARWRLALWDCIPGKNSWSSAYSVLSIMLQLQVFLLDEDLHYAHQQVTPETAVAKACELTCPDCPHEGADNIHPPFPTAADLAAASLRAKQTVAKPFVPARSRRTAQHLTAHQKQVPVQAPMQAASAANSGSAGSTCSSGGHSVAASSFVSNSNSSSTRAASVASADSSFNGSSAASSAAGNDSSTAREWVMVKCKGRTSRSRPGSNSRYPAPAAQVAAAHTATASQVMDNSRFAALRAASAEQQQLEPQQSWSALAAAPTTCVPGLQQQQRPHQPSKSAKKNMTRNRKRRQTPCAAAATAAPAAAYNDKATTSQDCSSKIASQASSAAAVINDSAAWIEVGGKKAAKHQAQQEVYISPLQQQLKTLQQQPMSALIQQCMAGDSFRAPAAAASQEVSAGASYGSDRPAATADLLRLQQQHCDPVSAVAAGPFSLLPQDALLCILGQLSTADVAHLSQTCKALKVATADGAVWQLMMTRSFPGTKLTANNMTDWKTAYLMESACVLDELHCWYTRADFREDVLGLPLTYTVNPVTHKVDYILAHPDLLSVTAFKAGVRLTPTGEKFDTLLPLYLTADHFNRALPHLQPLLKQLAPEHVPQGGGCPAPDTWLEVIPKILNTQVVLLADNGLTASQRSLSINCQVYRLLLAVCEHWMLWPKVSARLTSFLQRPAQRIKAACPNLGLLLPLLSCSPAKHSWHRMSAAVLQEALDRNVLWMCKSDPSLVTSFRAAPGNSADMVLLHGSWAGAAVSCRLMAFHLAFLQLVAASKGSSLETVMDSMDAMYGWPAAALGPRFTNVVRRIQQLDGWQSWFQQMGCKIPTAAAMSDLLRSAWRQGEKKGYHSAKTDFSKIHASGVSKILVKGQSYSTPPGTKSVELEVHYKWKPEFTVRYLDGAVLLFGPGRRFKEMIAWNNHRSSSTAHPGAVTHSGDIMEFDQQQGLNKAKVVFDQLGHDVCEAFITLSAWNDAMLSDIIQPYVQLNEPSTGVELCQCHLDSKDIEVKKAHKCIIMARLYREPAGGWGVQSVGSFCQGHTGSHGFGVMEGNNPLTPLGKMVQGVKALSL